MSERRANELGSRGRRLLNLESSESADQRDGAGEGIRTSNLSAATFGSGKDNDFIDFQAPTEPTQKKSKKRAGKPAASKSGMKRAESSQDIGSSGGLVRTLTMGGGVAAFVAIGAFMMLDMTPAPGPTMDVMPGEYSLDLAQGSSSSDAEALYARIQQGGLKSVETQVSALEQSVEIDVPAYNEDPAIDVDMEQRISSGSLMAGSLADMQNRLSPKELSALGLASGSSESELSPSDVEVTEMLSDADIVAPFIDETLDAGSNAPANMAEGTVAGPELDLQAAQDRMLAELDGLLEGNKTSDHAQGSVKKVMASCGQFAEDLNACRPSRCRLIDSASGKRIGGEVLGELNGNCLYEHAAEGDLRRACTLARPERAVAASYYAALTEGDQRRAASFAVGSGSSGNAHLQMRDVFERAMALVLEDRARCRILAGIKSDW